MRSAIFISAIILSHAIYPEGEMTVMTKIVLIVLAGMFIIADYKEYDNKKPK